jgi:predicted ester cyclase
MLRRTYIYGLIAMLLLATVAAWLFATPAAVDAAGVPAAEDAKAVAAAYFEQLMSEKGEIAADAVLASGFQRIDRAAPKAVLGAKGTQFMVAYLHQAFPDLTYHIDAVAVEGNTVAICWTASGTHAGTLRMEPATGKTVTWTGMSFLTLEDGKLVQEMTNLESLDTVLGLNEGQRLSPSYAQ